MPGGSSADRVSLAVAGLCMCLGAPFVILGMTALHTVCDPWSDEHYFSTWSLLDSTLICCNSSCPAMEVLGNCDWVNGNMSHFGENCVVGHAPPFKWCWSDDRCFVGDYNNVGIAIVLISFGTLFVSASLGLCATGLCPTLPVFLWRLKAKRRLGLQLKKLRRRGLLFLWITGCEGVGRRRARSSAVTGRIPEGGRRADKRYLLLPFDLRLLVLEFYMLGPYDVESDAGEDGAGSDASAATSVSVSARQSPSLAGASLLNITSLPPVWRDQDMTRLIVQLFDHLSQGTTAATTPSLKRVLAEDDRLMIEHLQMYNNPPDDSAAKPDPPHAAESPAHDPSQQVPAAEPSSSDARLKQREAPVATSSTSPCNEPADHSLLGAESDQRQASSMSPRNEPSALSSLGPRTGQGQASAAGYLSTSPCKGLPVSSAVGAKTLQRQASGACSSVSACFSSSATPIDLTSEEASPCSLSCSTDFQPTQPPSPRQDARLEQSGQPGRQGSSTSLRSSDYAPSPSDGGHAAGQSSPPPGVDAGDVASRPRSGPLVAAEAQATAAVEFQKRRFHRTPCILQLMGKNLVTNYGAQGSAEEESTRLEVDAENVLGFGASSDVSTLTVLPLAAVNRVLLLHHSTLCVVGQRLTRDADKKAVLSFEEYDSEATTEPAEVVVMLTTPDWEAWIICFRCFGIYIRWDCEFPRCLTLGVSSADVQLCCDLHVSYRELTEMSDVALHRFGSRPFTLYDLRKRVSVDCHTCTQFADILVSRGDLQCVTMSSVTGLHWKAYVASSPHGKPPAPAPAAVEPSAADDSGDEKQGLLDSFDRSGSGLSVQTRRPTATSSRPIAAASSSRPACDLSINDE